MTVVLPNPYSPYADADPLYRHTFPTILPSLFGEPAPGALAETGCERMAVVPDEPLQFADEPDAQPPTGLCPACITAMHGGHLAPATVSECQRCESTTRHIGLCAVCRQEQHADWWQASDTFARPFRLVLPGERVLDGVHFPRGRAVIVDDPDVGLASSATIEQLVSCYHRAEIMWAEDVVRVGLARMTHAVQLYASTAVELEDARRANAELTHDAERFKEDHLGACGTIAEMHAAATGRTGLGPIRGVVEDVADVRERADKVARGLHIYVHALRGRPGREISTEYALHCLTQLIAHPEKVCALDRTAAALDQIRSLVRRLAAHAVGFKDVLEESDSGPWGKTVGADIAELSRALTALDGPSQPVMTGPHHFGRSWSGHDIEDACPCTKAPCGLVSEPSAECTEHTGTKSTRQSHPADACPGATT